QERAGNLRRDWTPERLGDGFGLVGAEGDDQDRAGGQDRGHADGERARDHAGLVAEILGGVDPGDRVEVDQAGGQTHGRFGGKVARFVEADVAVPAESEELEVEAAVGGNPAIVLRRVL